MRANGNVQAERAARRWAGPRRRVGAVAQHACGRSCSSLRSPGTCRCRLRSSIACTTGLTTSRNTSAADRPAGRGRGDQPLPGYRYQLTWILDRRQDHESRLFSQRSLAVARRIRLLVLSDGQRQSVARLLDELHGRFDQTSDDVDLPILGEHTQLALSLARERNVDPNDLPSTVAYLKQIACRAATAGPCVDQRWPETGASCNTKSGWSAAPGAGSTLRR